MTPAAERYARAQEVFDAAADLLTKEQAALLDERCAGDETLRREVEALLAADARADSLDAQPFAIPREVFDDAPDEQFVGRQFGPYEIVRELGRGGLGAVYLAVRSDGEYRKEVALKLIRRGLDTDDILRRFRNERQILAQLDHPNIARLVDGGTTDDGLPYFVMEYVKGDPIAAYCDTFRLNTAQRLALFRKVCAAVTYAHQNLVIHRDLKPSNILVTPDGEPKLLDFGIAKLLRADDESFTLTEPGSRAMTPDYASPEQINGDRITTASDVYSLGVLLYELLSGQKPYRLKTRSAGEISRAIREQTPEPPSTALARSAGGVSAIQNPKAIRGDLDNIALMAMRKEPARRYASVGELAEDIRRYTEGRPVLAHKDTLRYRAGKFIGRNKAAVTAAVLVAVLLVSGLAATLWQTQIARRERDRARMAERASDRLNQFLQRLLSSANPDGMGRDVRVVQVLDAAAARLDRELGSEPQLLAQAHLTIARAYAQLRSAEPAETHARAALAIDQRIFGDDHPATAEAMAFLGRAMQVFRRFNEAEPLLRNALAVMRRHPPADRNDLASSLEDLSWVLIATGRAPEAAPLTEEALAISREVKGERSVEAAAAWNNVGLLRAALKDPAGAKIAYRTSLDINRTLTPTPLSFLNPLANLSQLLFGEGNLAEVEALLQEGERFCRESVGVDNPTYGALLGRLGVVDFAKQDYAAASSKLQRCIETVGAVYPKTEPEMVLARAVLGLSLTRTGRAAEAEPYLREALISGKNVPRPALALVGNLEGALGECLIAEGKAAEAEPLLVLAHEELQSRLGDSHISTVRAREELASARKASAQNRN